MVTSRTEALIREQFIKIFKKYIGKGPRGTEVKIFKKMVVVIFEDVLTPLEKNLLAVGHNKEQVSKIRDKIAEPALEEYRQILIQITGDRIVEVLCKNNLEANERYYLFVFENNVEKIIKEKENFESILEKI